MATFTSGGRGFKQPTAITSFGPDLFIANGAGSVSERRDQFASLDLGSEQSEYAPSRADAFVPCAAVSAGAMGNSSQILV